MPDDSFLTQIIRDTGPFTAEYVPTPIAEKPATGCDLPAPVLTKLKLPTLPVVKNDLDCNLNFFPAPIVPVPFIPPFEGPCPDGFRFESQFIPIAGQCLTQLAASGGYRPLVLQNFTAADAGINSDTDFVLPDIRLTIPVTNNGTEVSGSYKYPIVAGRQYHVSLASYDYNNDKTKGIVYNGVTYKNGQSFRGVAGVTTAAASHSNINSRLQLDHVQHKQILDYDRTTGGTVYIDQTGFVLPNSNPVCNFTFNRLVIAANQNKETGGEIRFVQEECGGKLVGEINLNFDDLNIPCADGVTFDAGYSPKAGEVLTVSNSGSRVSSSSIDLVALVPSGTSPDTGLAYPMPHLRFKTGASTWTEVPVTSVNNDTNGVWLNIGAGVPDANYSEWYLQRINVESGAATGGHFEFIKEGSCGGKLVGLISINVPGLTTPCATALENNTLVSTSTNFGTGDDVNHDANWRALKNVDRLRSNSTPNATGWTTGDATTNFITLAKEASNCSYKLGFNGGAQINLPDVQIQLRIGNDGQWQRFKRTYSDAVTDTVTFEATIDRGQLGGGGNGGNSSCLSCCRWS